MREIQGILNDIRKADWPKRKNVFKNLLAYPEDAYLSILEDWLRNDEDALSRNIAMEAYRELGEKALASLFGLLKDADTDVRVFAANLLGDIRDKKAIHNLISLLKDPDVNVRIASAESLGKLGDESAVDALSKAVNDDPWVAISAIEAIGEIGGEKALSFLYKCLNNKEYRGITFAAIEKAGDQHFIRHLTPFVDSEDEMRELALKAIVNIADREGIRPMPSYFLSLIPLLKELQKSPQPELRRAAFIALSWSEDISGLQYFIDAINDDELQEYAIKGIIALGKKAIPEIIAAMKKPGRNRVVFAKILSMLGENHALLRFANDEDPEVRTEVALAIADLKAPKAKEALLILEKDASDEVRAAAKLSLEKIKEGRG